MPAKSILSFQVKPYRVLQETDFIRRPEFVINILLSLAEGTSLSLGTLFSPLLPISHSKQSQWNC